MSKIPAWFNEIKRFCSTKSVFLLSGNIRDYFPFYNEPSQGALPIPYKIKEYLKEMLAKEGYNAFVLYDPIDGFSSLQAGEDIIGSFAKGKRPDEAIVSIREMLRATKDRHLVVIFDYSSRVVSNPSHLSPTELRFFTVVEKISHEIVPFKLEGKEDDHPLCNLLIMLLQKENDFPSWLSYNNPGLKSIVIPKPHAGVREEMAQSFINIFPGAFELSPQEKREAAKKFASLTEKMLLLDMQAIGLLAKKEGVNVKKRLEEAVRRYKTGIREDPWQYLQEKITKEAEQILDRHIKGQEHVKKKVLEILSRTALGLSGAHLGQNINRPKGVFFFAGPTGVGKTQTAKAIADIVFSDPNALVRFDMSEFSEPHTDQRLIGAPPGYVGYQQGGELTNAVRENPFTLLLFDEIEKAHPKILDIFLQILDDGRLTDAKGETVYFSEAIIVFTTNLGVYRYDEKTGKRIPLVNPEDDFSTVESRILEYIENYFRFVLARPELFNRIGKSNILVFDFIRQDVAQQIFEKFLTTFLSNVESLHGIKITLSPQTKEGFMKACISDLTYGGRGIAQAFEAFAIGKLLSIIKDAKNKGLKEIMI